MRRPSGRFWSLLVLLLPVVASPLFAQTPVQRLTQQGFEAYRRGDLEAAAGTFRQTTTLAPTDGLTWFNLGLVLADQGKLGEAAAAYEKTRLLHADGDFKIISSMVDLDEERVEL